MRVLPSIEEMRDFAKSVVPECLSPAQRSRFGLEPDPPRWCIELNKPPYDTAEWKQWSADKLTGKKPPIPERTHRFHGRDRRHRARSNSSLRKLRASWSSTALTMPVSSLSTKAWATSTYSAMTTRAGTSLR